MKRTEAEIIQAIWNDPEEHEAFFANPKEYLLEQGREIPDSTRVTAYEDTLSLRHFVLPTEGTQLPEGDDPLTQIAKQAMEDSEFKAKLLENPKTVAQEMGITIPDGLEIKILENQPDAMNVIVPFNPACRELSDADLEAVAGGKLTQVQKCGIGAGSTGVACGGAAIAAAVFAFTIVTVATAAVAGGTSAVAAGATAIGSNAAG